MQPKNRDVENAHQQIEITISGMPKIIDESKSKRQTLVQILAFKVV